MSAAAASRRELPLRIERICRQPLTAKALREHLVDELRPALPFDGFNFPLIDPQTLIATSPFADVPGLPWPRLPELIRWRYLTTLCRWDRVVAAGQVATSLTTETEGELARSLLWQHVQRELGVIDTAIVVFADRYGCWGMLDLWRTRGEPFTGAELALLASAADAITVGLRHSVARTFVDPEHHLLPLGPAIVILGSDLRLRTQTAAAGRALLALNPPDEPIAPVPAAAYNIGAALLAAEHNLPIGPVWSRIHLGGSRWVTVKASRLDEDIAVSIEPCTPDERMDIYARASGLSGRESQILSLLAQGLDTRQIAERIVVSEHTATDHVKAILAKTGARTRQVLLARGLGAGMT
jgi:DNA-binding CsgD family transcriptional regulator